MLLWLGFSVGFLTGVAVYVVFQLAFNMPHNFQTWTVSVLDGEDRARNGNRYLVALIVCVLTGHGLKDPDIAIRQSSARPVSIAAERGAVERAIFDNLGHGRGE